MERGRDLVGWDGRVPLLARRRRLMRRIVSGNNFPSELLPLEFRD
jgi:hypothetical protein